MKVESFLRKFSDAITVMKYLFHRYVLNVNTTIPSHFFLMWPSTYNFLPGLYLHEQHYRCHIWIRFAYPTGTHEITSTFKWGSSCSVSILISFVLNNIVCLFLVGLVFLFTYGIISFFSTYEFRCPIGIFFTLNFHNFCWDNT